MSGASPAARVVVADVAQVNAKTGEPVKVVRFNGIGTVDLTYPVRIAGEDIRCGDRVRVADDGLTIYRLA